MTSKQIRNSLKKLESTKEISIKGASKGTMITVCKYDSYQDTKEEKGEQMGKPRANDGRAKGEQRATNKNDNNTNNEKEEQEDAPLLESEFDTFWNLYGKKVKTIDCQREWYLIDELEYPKILEHVPKFVSASGNFLCNPIKYLKGKMWQDEDLPDYGTKGDTQKPAFTPYKMNKPDY